MEKVKISIIVPVYNASAYLKRCLDSITNQTLPDIEILIYDDCSSDNSTDIILHYKSKDKRIKFTKNIENIGSGAIRNLGINNAKGKYILFVDSDDWIDSRACELMYYHSELLRTEILVGNYHSVYKQVVPKEHPASIQHTVVYNGKSFLKQNKIFTAVWDKLWLREFVIKNNLRNIEEKYSQDLPMVTEGLILAKRVASVDFKFYYYFRGNLNSVTKGSSTEKHFNDRIWTMQYIRGLIDTHKESEINNRLLWLLANQVFSALSNIRRYKGNNLQLKRKLLKQINYSAKVSGIQLLKVESFPYYKKILAFVSPTLYSQIFELFDRLKEVILSNK